MAQARSRFRSRSEGRWFLPLPGYLQTEGPVTLASIRKARKATWRGKHGTPAHIEWHESRGTTGELEIYLNYGTFDLSSRIGRVERYLKDQGRVENAPPEIMSELEESLRELKFLADIAHFAISKMNLSN
jgi:hypothetical protein